MYIGLHVKCLLLVSDFNPLNAELNPICYLLALLGAYHFLHVSRIRVNLTRSFSTDHKIKQHTLESQNTTIYIYIHIYIYIYIYQTMVTANNYLFRLLTGHHQVVHLMKRAEGCTIYNVTSV